MGGRHEDDEVTQEWVVAWDGEVLMHGPHGTVRLRGLSLGRRSMLAEGDWTRYLGDEVTLELELETRRIFVVAGVETSRGSRRCMLRFGVTSPEGNDLIARHVRSWSGAVNVTPRAGATIQVA